MKKEHPLCDRCHGRVPLPSSLMWAAWFEKSCEGQRTPTGWCGAYDERLAAPIYENLTEEEARNVVRVHRNEAICAVALREAPYVMPDPLVPEAAYARGLEVARARRYTPEDCEAYAEGLRAWACTDPR